MTFGNFVLIVVGEQRPKQFTPYKTKKPKVVAAR
jgi:hypothetical protein